MSKNKEIKQPYEDTTKPIKERQNLYNIEMDKMMNPVDNFNPDTFEPMGEDIRLVANRIKKIPDKELPLFNMKPKEIRVGQMIGMFESKQDLYLIFAHRCNEMQKEIDGLKDTINKLVNKIK